ncbi:hypothetical protein JD844_003813 [Phrynosoma platyrhinos]|uniref:Uncharacterized protein n=1 Tax=Phrynosoma platyrhinos TaxID=52577 RepID=A0ABQ7TEX2_PHRPL|nr:hypothetical protein JD844_003813 [Phrynosoma platyrhinos]
MPRSGPWTKLHDARAAGARQDHDHWSVQHSPNQQHQQLRKHQHNHHRPLIWYGSGKLWGAPGSPGFSKRLVFCKTEVLHVSTVLCFIKRELHQIHQQPSSHRLQLMEPLRLLQQLHQPRQHPDQSRDTEPLKTQCQ